MKIVMISLQGVPLMAYGLLSLIDALLQRGHEVRFLRLPNEGYVRMFQKPGSREAIFRAIESFEPDMVGVSAMTQTSQHLPWMTTLIKQRCKVPIIIGGYHVQYAKERVLEEVPQAEYALYGEAEESLPAFLESFAHGAPSCEDIPGLIYRKEGRITCNSPPPLVDLGKYLPWRALTTIFSVEGATHEESYDDEIVGMLDRIVPLSPPVIPLLLTRGCPYRCTFCKLDGALRYDDFTRHMPVEVFDRNLDYVIRAHKRCSLYLQDSSFDIDKKWATQICERIKARPEITDWFCQLRPDLVTEEFVDVLVRSRCRGVNLYLESGDERIRNEILNKRVSDAKVREAFTIVRNAGLVSRCNIILGNPTESVSGFFKSFAAACELKPTSIQAVPLKAYPGTPIAVKYQDHLVLKEAKVLDPETYEAKTIKGTIGYIDTGVPRKLVRTLAGAFNCYGHCMARVLRDLVQVNARRIAILDIGSDPSLLGSEVVGGRRADYEFVLTSFGLPQVVVSALWLPNHPEGEGPGGLLIGGRDLKVIPELVPSALKVVRFEASPLSFPTDGPPWTDLQGERVDSLVVPHLGASKEVLAQIAQVCRALRARHLYLLDALNGCITQWDSHTKMTIQQRYVLSASALSLHSEVTAGYSLADRVTA